MTPPTPTRSRHRVTWGFGSLTTESAPAKYRKPPPLASVDKVPGQRYVFKRAERAVFRLPLHCGCSVRHPLVDERAVFRLPLIAAPEIVDRRPQSRNGQSSDCPSIAATNPPPSTETSTGRTGSLPTAPPLRPAAPRTMDTRGRRTGSLPTAPPLRLPPPDPWEDGDG